MAEKLDFQVLATTIMGATNESVEGFLKVKPDRDPTVVTKDLYADDKLEICTYGEFVDGSHISVIYFYRSQRDRETNRFCGMLILYVSTSAINYVVRAFGYKNAKDAGDEMAADAAAELCNNIAGIFKKDLKGLGYAELEISPPFKFKGFAGRLDYPVGQKKFHRVTAYVWGQTITMDVILAM